MCCAHKLPLCGSGDFGAFSAEVDLMSGTTMITRVQVGMARQGNVENWKTKSNHDERGKTESTERRKENNGVVMIVQIEMRYVVFAVPLLGLSVCCHQSEVLLWMNESVTGIFLCSKYAQYELSSLPHISV